MDYGQQSEAIASGLSRIRSKRRMLWIIFFFFLAVFILSFFVADSSPGIIGVRWMLAGLFWLTDYLIYLIKCPRCEKQFHRKKNYFYWLLHNRIPGSCVHCGLELNPKKA